MNDKKPASEPPLVLPEATPASPAPSQRALRTMAVVRWALLALVTLLAAYSVWSVWGPPSLGHAPHGEPAARRDRYQCPMHPEIRSPEPGQCPICHMDLVPIPDERGNEAHHDHAAHASPQADQSAPMPGLTAVSLSSAQQSAIGLTTTVVERARVGDLLRVPALVRAPETGLAEVRVRAPGFVEEVFVRQSGVRVSKGQTLALVYSPEIYRAQEEFLAALQWTRLPPGVPSAPPGAPSVPSGGPTAGATGDIIAAARRGLELLGMTPSDIDEVANTQKPRRAIAVRAPASGFVTRFNAILGSRAEPELVLYEIADLSSVWVLASVHERDLHGLARGQKAIFFPAGHEGLALEAKIDLIEPLVDEATRTTAVRMVLKNPEGTLRPGQFGEVELDLPASDSLFVPRDAVIRTGEREYLYVASDAEDFEPRAVQTGRLREGRVEIVAGLKEGERVVTRGSFLLDSESRLRASLSARPDADGPPPEPLPDRPQDRTKKLAPLGEAEPGRGEP